MTMQGLKYPLFAALDVDTPEEAFRLASQLEGHVGGFKVGPRLVLPQGKNLVSELSRIAPLFLDCKFFDIPSTMEHAVRAAFQMGASFVTIHASSGPRAMELMAKVEAELREQRPFTILAVTVLTSFNDQDLQAIGVNKTMEDQVVSLAKTAHEAGLGAVVCSPLELNVLRKALPEMRFVVPGIRSEEDVADDQNRTMTPSQAIAAGASALVVGRPILRAPDPALAAEKILLSLKSGR
jgi:orotidine-5'-phosphate decarboxylase